ncbi:FmdB family zinc ribbon protein [Ketobacter sp.]|uniref:FmdB family zinc ribbon protein n=1 Tax=Ketobacter sp. TaxID=2083498 RepID=UPI000F0EF0E1|nr:zinc ribbon domain-containing protein [Ketobacter sp.]RLU01508.1 MAG: zinc ribbon domain-containing protein [Ketobacter sp.]
MPIYEYQCQSCGHELEAIQKMSDAPLTDCPQCQESTLKKRISAAGFRLSGSGWYETDFKTGKKKNLANQDTGSAPKSADKPTSPSAS